MIFISLFFITGEVVWYVTTLLLISYFQRYSHLSIFLSIFVQAHNVNFMYWSCQNKTIAQRGPLRDRLSPEKERPRTIKIHLFAPANYLTAYKTATLVLREQWNKHDKRYKTPYILERKIYMIYDVRFVRCAAKIKRLWKVTVAKDWECFSQRVLSTRTVFCHMKCLVKRTRKGTRKESKIKENSTLEIYFSITFFRFLAHLSIT